ncbi:MAG: phenylalanine--tRNA ligase subunit alpha [Candidatus Nanohaloarchaea archaeon]
MELSEQAFRILKQLREKERSTEEELVSEGFDQSMVHGAALELEEKDLARVEEEDRIVRELSDTGEEVVEEGSPEHRFIQRVDEGDDRLSDLSDMDLDVALGKAREKGWVDVDGGEVRLTGEGEEALEEDVLQDRLESGDLREEDEERGLVETGREKTREIILTDRGKDLDLEDVEMEFNVEARAETPRTGKKHFYKEIISFAREKWIEMGFEEMSGDFVVSSLLNFDGLYTPQDHPARELHDTFFMEEPESADLDVFGEKVDNVRETHEDGWTTGSSGWGYDWSREEAAKNVLRTHTTAVSARKLHEIDIEEEELPKKFFTVARNFRNETVDRTHMAEFLQTDGIVVGEDLNFAHLKGYISRFFEKMGYDEFRLIPSYYPYTEMSVQVEVWDDHDGEWMELGGAGMFRPEVVKPLLGFEASVLAWGLGIPRIAMKAAELKDIRELYRNDIENLEQTPVWRP